MKRNGKSQKGLPSTFRKSAGFTAIELLTAFAVFTTISVVAGGVFITAMKLNRKSLNIQRADENARNILEMMAREIRVANTIEGSDVNCSSVSPVNSLSFTHPVNGKIRYFHSGTQLHKEVEGNDSIINSSDVRVTDLKFCLKGLASGDARQARVTVQLTFESGQGNEMITNQLQTTLSQRRLIDD